jgi:sigma-B regulation protein RsbU (phosphoserine phosphatase)
MLGGILGSVRALVSRGEPLVQIASELNRTLWELAPEDSFTSFLCAEIDASHRCLRYVNAGHEPALLLRGNCERVERLDSTGAVLGLSRKSAYRERLVFFEPGDLVAAFTEGLADSMGPDGVVGMLRERTDWRLQDLAADVVEAETAETDRTLVLVRFTDANAHPTPLEARELVAA